MRLFLDTNVLLDVFLHRSGRAESLRVLAACVAPGNEGWIAWHTLSNAFYIVRRETRSVAEAQRFASELLQWASVATVGTADAVAAEQLKMNDLEDALQITAAQACQADAIITRNLGDFALSPIPVLSPDLFLAQHPSF